MASAQSLLGLVSQLQSMETSFSAILMEAAMKLSALTDANIFVLVETGEGRKFSGKRHLCDAYLRAQLTPTGNDVEYEVNPAVSSLQLRRHHHHPGAMPTAPDAYHLQGRNNHHQASSQPQRNFSTSFTSSSTNNNNNNGGSSAVVAAVAAAAASTARQAFPFPSPPTRKRLLNPSIPESSSSTPPKMAKLPEAEDDTAGAAGSASADDEVVVKDETEIKKERTEPIKSSEEEGEIDSDIAEIINDLPASKCNGIGGAGNAPPLASTSSSSSVAPPPPHSSTAGPMEILGWESAFDAAAASIDETSAGAFDAYNLSGADLIDNGLGVGGGVVDAELMALLNQNLSAQKIQTLKCIAGENACVKGTPENRLSTSLCYDFGKALAEAKPEDMDELQSREFFFKNFEIWVSQFENLKRVFHKALPHGRPESGQTLTLLGFMRMSARSGFAQRSKRLKQLRQNEHQRRMAEAFLHGNGGGGAGLAGGVLSW